MNNTDDMIASINASHNEKKKEYNYQQYLKEQQQAKKIRFTFMAAAATIVVLAGSYKVVKYTLEKTVPLNVATEELAIDTEMILTDNGRTIDDKMTKQELIDYIDQNDLSDEQLVDALVNYAEKHDINARTLLDKAQEANPDAISISR